MEMALLILIKVKSGFLLEAIYLALKNQGYDADLLLAQLYDTGLR
jgi:hypothetical protein